MTDDVYTRFNVTFPWYDHGRWGWSYAPTESGNSHWYREADGQPPA
jgi:hypothetical protein